MSEKNKPVVPPTHKAPNRQYEPLTEEKGLPPVKDTIPMPTVKPPKKQK